MAQVLEQVGDEAREILALVGELLDEGEQAGRVAVDDRGRRGGRALPPRPRRAAARTAWTVTFPSVAEASWSSVETASRKLPRALRAISESAASGASISSPSATRRRSFVSSASRGRAKRKVWQRERTVGSILPSVGRAEDEDEVRRRLLDQLQQRVEGGVGELVRLVEDVDLEASLDRLQDDVLADLAHVVDPALARRIHLDHVERRAGRDRHGRSCRSCRGVDVGPCSQLSALARMRASDVFPVPRGPGEEVGLAHLVVARSRSRSVRTTASCPTTSSKSCGRYLR